MRRSALHALTVTALIGLAACGEAPQGAATSTDIAAPGPNLQRISFTGVAEPSSGRLQFVAEPQPALAPIDTDANGDPGTVTAGTAQLYGTPVTITSNTAQYPAACNPGAPEVMFANVEVFSGFKEQLRNVYTRINAVSGGKTFCSKATTPAAFTSTLDPNVGLYLYRPLNGGAAPSAIRRSVQWALNLPDNGAFWFSGELFAEVIPQPPTNILPIDGDTIHTNTTTTRVNFSWTDDPLADGTDPEGFGVNRPTRGAIITIDRCNRVSSGPYDPASCTTNITRNNLRTGGTYRSQRLSIDRWYRWSLQTSFLLPGNGTTRTLGTQIMTRTFSIVRP